MEEIIVPSRYGETHGLLSHCSKESIILLLPGFGASKKTKQFNLIEEMILSKDISTLRIDQYGHGDNSELFPSLTVTKAIEVVEECINYLHKEDYERIGILGSSFGGLTGFFASLHSPFVSLLLLKSPVLKDQGRIIAEFKNISIKEWKENSFAEWTDKLGEHRLSYQFYEDANKYSVINSIKNSKIPIKIVQGGSDTVVPVAQCLELEKEENVNVSIIPSANHKLNTEEEKEMVFLFKDFLYDHWK